MLRITVSLAMAASAVVATAAPVMPTRYDMANGSGQANGGQFNYWDLAYSGSGSTTTDGAALSAGLGDLTDGLVTPQNWFNAESAAGNGPYVGWRTTLTPNPSVTFAFAPGQSIDTIEVHADDSGGAGGVDLPSSVLISWAGGSQSFAVTDPDPASTAPVWLSFGGLGIQNATSVTVQFFHDNQWVFVDEVRFDGGAAVPLPGTLTLAGLPLLVVAGMRRRRVRGG